jgi:hypothetical protein
MPRKKKTMKALPIRMHPFYSNKCADAYFLTCEGFSAIMKKAESGIIVNVSESKRGRHSIKRATHGIKNAKLKTPKSELRVKTKGL